MTRRRIAGSLAVAWLWGASAAATGCATYTDKTERMRVAVQRGDLAGGLEETNKNLGVRSDTALKLGQGDAARGPGARHDPAWAASL